MSVRVCWPSFDDLMRYEDGRVVGPLAIYGSYWMDRVLGMNVTMVYKSSVGKIMDHEKNLYDGCIGSMQQNESDIVLSPYFAYPVPGPNLYQGLVSGAHRVALISAYNRSTAAVEHGTHVMDFVLSFTPGLWVLTIAMFLVLRICLWLALKGEKWMTEVKKGKKKKKRTKKSRVHAMESIMEEGPPSDDDNAPSITTVLLMELLIAVFGFLISFYLTSMIKTDMVVVKPPITVQNYDELIASGRRPVWFDIGTEWMTFKFAKRGSKERQIWDIAVRMGINQSFIGNSGSAVLSQTMAVANLKAVMIAHNEVTGMILRDSCAFSRSKEVSTDVNPLARIDDSAHDTVRGHVYSSFFNPETRARVENLTEWEIEAGTGDALPRFIDAGAWFEPDIYAKHSAIMECSSNVVKVPHPEFQAVDPAHYLSLLWLSLALIGFSGVVLLYEFYLKQ